MAVTGADIGVYRLTAQSDAISTPVRVLAIWYVGGTTAGHLATVLAGSGGPRVAHFVVDAANFTDVRIYHDHDGRGKYFPELLVSDLDSGEIYVHVA